MGGPGGLRGRGRGKEVVGKVEGEVEKGGRERERG